MFVFETVIILRALKNGYNIILFTLLKFKKKSRMKGTDKNIQMHHSWETVAFWI